MKNGGNDHMAGKVNPVGDITGFKGVAGFAADDPLDGLLAPAFDATDRETGPFVLLVCG